MSTTATVPGPRPVTATTAQDNAGGRPPPQPGGTRPAPQGHPGRAGLAALASLAISFAAPLLAYYLIRPHAGSSALALALAGAIPVAYTLVMLAARRRLDPAGAASVASFGIAVLISWASGGNTLALELHDPALTGLIGIACLVSVAIGRPLHPVILRLLGRNARYAGIASRTHGRTSMVTTTIIGMAFTGHAVAVAVLALTQPTSAFVALQHPVGLPFFGLGIAGLFFYRSRLQARRAAASAARNDPPGQQLPSSHTPGHQATMVAGKNALQQGGKLCDGPARVVLCGSAASPGS